MLMDAGAVPLAGVTDSHLAPSFVLAAVVNVVFEPDEVICTDCAAGAVSHAMRLPPRGAAYTHVPERRFRSFPSGLRCPAAPLLFPGLSA